MGELSRRAEPRPTHLNSRAKTLTRTVPFYRPDVGEEEIAAVLETLRSGWLTTGPRTQQFERDFAEAIGSAHAVAVSSCTAALHLALNAIDLKSADLHSHRRCHRARRRQTGAGRLHA
jgi:hypothetical protein